MLGSRKWPDAAPTHRFGRATGDTGLCGPGEPEQPRRRQHGEAERRVTDGGTRPATVEAPLERMTDGFVALDTDWTVTYANDSAVEMLGENGSGLVGEVFWELLHDDVEARDPSQQYREAMETQESMTFETYAEPLGTWFEVRAYPDENGLSVFVRDVTEHKRTRRELSASGSAMRRLHEIISDADLPADAKLARLLDLGRDRLDVEIGFLSRIESDTWEAIEWVGDHPDMGDGLTMPLSQSYCRRVIDKQEPLTVLDAVDEGWAGDPAYESWGLSCYLGGTVTVDDETYGTVCFGDTDARGGPFTDSEVAFVELVTDWVGYVIERDRYETELREQRRRLETLTDHVPVVLFALDTEGTFTLTRGQGLEALGFEREQAVGESVFDIYEGYPTVIEHTERALAGEDAHVTVELDSGVVLEVWYQPVIDDGEVEQVVGVVRDITEYERQQTQLEREQAFVESLLDSLPDPLYAFDDSDGLIRWNDRLETVTGYESDELDGRPLPEFVAEADRDQVREAIQRVRAGDQMSVEADVETRAGDHLPYELSGAPMREDGDVVGLTGVARDVSERQARQEMLSGLLETTRSLMQARDRQEVAEIAANAAREVLGFDITLVRLYDAETGTLRPAARTEEMVSEMGERPVYEVGEGIPGQVFATGEPRVIAEGRAASEIVNRGRVRSLIYHPMGVHGTISVGSTEPGDFDETDQQVLALLSTAAAAACTRAKREREVREAREHTERVLDRVNGLIEDTVEVLVQATTREELESGVAAELAAADPYTFAWIGQPNVASETLSPSTWTGEADVPIEGLTVDLTDDGPIASAYRSGSPQIVQDLGTKAATLPGADAGYGEGVESCMIIPLEYKNTIYGVLAVFADEPDAFDEREQVVLGALGRAAANAVNAVERGRIMDATEIIELELAVDDSALLFCRLSRRGDCRVEVAGTDYRADGSIRQYLAVDGTDGETLAALARENSSVGDVTVIADHDEECLLELTVTESVLATLSEFGTIARDVVAENGTTRITVELPYETEAREVFELIEGHYPNTSLAGYHERERPVETRQEFRGALFDRFTDRQETALRTAYLGGFFQWPRDVDGNELAEAMDISRPTYHQHLRAAQRKVFEKLFD